MKINILCLFLLLSSVPLLAESLHQSVQRVIEEQKYPVETVVLVASIKAAVLPFWTKHTATTNFIGQGVRTKKSTSYLPPKDLDIAFAADLMKSCYYLTDKEPRLKRFYERGLIEEIYGLNPEVTFKEGIIHEQIEFYGKHAVLADASASGRYFLNGMTSSAKEHLLKLSDSEKTLPFELDNVVKSKDVAWDLIALGCVSVDTLLGFYGFGTRFQQRMESLAHELKSYSRNTAIERAEKILESTK